jgi:pyroglutamyl-peptidase
MKRALLTGFGPFGTVTDNPSQRIVEALNQTPIERCQLITEVFPVSYHHVRGAFPALLADYSPDVVLMLGVAVGESRFRLEQMGHNRADPCASDCEGRRWKTSVIDLAGADFYLTGLVLAPLRDALRERGIAACISDSPGSYLCNFAYYHALQAIANMRMTTECLFLHLPADERTVSGSGDHPIVPFHQQVETTRFVLQWMLTAQRDRFQKEDFPHNAPAPW